ncbi:MAG: hypothetical protein C4551_10020 [Bacillota bacterium]|nr:MAG: hypothetical protein C4551_10020 [Bacillota bacterium]
MSEIFYLKQGNLRPSYVVILKDADKNPVNISTATAVRLHMKTPGGAIKVDAEMINRDDGTEALRGKCEYEWQAGDSDTAGTFYAEVEVTWPDTDPETFPNDGYNIVKITEKLA